MTNKQWKEKCSPVSTYHLNQAMQWKEFCSLPRDIQQKYLFSLIERFHTTASDLARMFGVNPTTVSAFCKQDDIGISFIPGKKMPKELRAEWESFSGVKPKTEEPAQKAEEPQSIAEEPAAPCETLTPCEEKADERSEESARSDAFAMNGFILRFSGPFDLATLNNSMLAMLPNGKSVNIEIKCTLDE